MYPTKRRKVVTIFMTKEFVNLWVHPCIQVKVTRIYRQQNRQSDSDGLWNKDKKIQQKSGDEEGEFPTS